MTPRRSRPAANGAARSQAGGRTSAIVPLTGCPCGCPAVRGQQCWNAEPWTLREPDDLGPRCEGTGRACGQFTCQQLAAIGRRGECCRGVAA